MKKKKIIYGIDLGTTNSIIGCNNRLITRLVSSKVDFKTKKTVPDYIVGDTIVGSYKVDMGLGDDGILAINASSIVLQTLKDKVKEETGDIVEDVIISVPAYFSTNQRTAVQVAAQKVGLNLINVINEPTAAAIQICSRDGGGTLRRGIYAVYDLGGGTFDVTIIDSRSGKYHVIATDGTILGGDDLDKAIADKVLEVMKIPIYKRDKMSMSKLIENSKKWKILMQEAYSAFSSDDHGEDIDIPIDLVDSVKEAKLTLTLKDYKKLVRDTFGKTVSILSHLVESKIPKGSDYKIVFVGGSTHDAYLCSYVLESSGIKYENAEFDTSPDYTVALGVVKYATSMQNGEEDVEFRDVTKQLSIEDSTGKAIVIIPANTNIPCKMMNIVTNSERTDKLKIKLYQGNSIIAKNNEYIGYIEYDYESVIDASRGDVEITASVDVSGIITLEVEDIVNFGEKKSIQLKGF